MVTASDQRVTQRPLRILSLDDAPHSVEGPLSSLRADGHVVSLAGDVPTAWKALCGGTFDVLLVDERLQGSTKGSDLVIAMDRGELGDSNVDLPFVFITGNEAWVEDDIEDLPGFVAILRKGGALTPQLRAAMSGVCSRRQSRLRPPLRRVMARVESPLDGGARVRLMIPSWDSDQTVAVAAGELPGARSWSTTDLVGRHYFVWMNLTARSATDVILARFEYAEHLGEDHD